MTINEIKDKLQISSIVDKYIYINVAVYVIALFIYAINYLQKSNSYSILKYFVLSEKSSEYLYKPYTFVTYGFIHLGFIHLLFNLIALYFLGNLFINFFSEKKFILYYILGSIFGGLFFVISYNYFPVFKNSNGTPLVGASAAISAILVGLATYMPNYEINLRLIGFVKLWILTTIFIVLSIVMIPNGNAGGQFAHLGGALIGFILTKYFNTEKTVYKQKSKSNLKTVYSSKNKSDDFGLSNHQKKVVQQRKIDTLLDKISKSGYESLSKNEREFLASASKNK